jgi:hypothetical protein
MILMMGQIYDIVRSSYFSRDINPFPFREPLDWI